MRRGQVPGPLESKGGSGRTAAGRTVVGRTSVSRRSSRQIAASLSSLFPLSFQVFHSPIDGGDEFMVSLAFGPSLFRSQHIGELGQHVAFFLHYFLSVSLTTRTGFLPPSPPAETETITLDHIEAVSEWAGPRMGTWASPLTTSMTK